MADVKAPTWEPTRESLRAALESCEDKRRKLWEEILDLDGQIAGLREAVAPRRHASSE
jgi:hypothetical protein